MRNRSWAWLLLVPTGLLLAVVLTAPFAAFHPTLIFSFTPDQFVDTVVRAGRSDARAALWLDNVFLLAWLVIVPLLLRAGLQRWAPGDRRLVGVWMGSPRLAVAAGVSGLAGNALALFAAGKSAPSWWLTWAIALIGTVTVVLVVVVVLALAMLVIGPVAGRQMGRRGSS